MNKTVAFFTGLGVGAGAMFILDPDRGKRRRALARDKAVSFANTSKETLEKRARDIRNRATGIVHETKALFADGGVPDSKLLERVKAALGRCAVHDRALTATVTNGTVTLSGDTLVNEVDTVVNAARSVRGVKDVVNNLNVHQSPEGISSLQGELTGPGS